MVYYIYAATLVLPYAVSLRHFAVTGMTHIPLLFGLAAALFWLRTLGVNKYLIFGQQSVSFESLREIGFFRGRHGYRSVKTHTLYNRNYNRVQAR